MSETTKFLFFDVGNTLLFPNRDRIHAPLTARGITPTPDHLNDLERRTKNQFDSLMLQNGHDLGFWSLYYTRLLEELGLADLPLRDQLVSAIRDSANWDQIRPGTRERLQDLARRYQLAVISNADGHIDKVLSRCGIADCFRTITDSGLVGFEKPHPEIFRQALKSLNAQPDASLYIGDVYSVDYLGATSAGMHAILMDVLGAYTDKGVPRVEDLQQLQIFLGNES
jgi:HAD superfamily hydrolase (TIGR01509 family)